MVVGNEKTDLINNASIGENFKYVENRGTEDILTYKHKYGNKTLKWEESSSRGLGCLL